MSATHDVRIEEVGIETWDVTCSCGFEVATLSSRESADDTRDWHLGGVYGTPSFIEDVTGIRWEPEDDS